MKYEMKIILSILLLSIPFFGISQTIDVLMSKHEFHTNEKINFLVLNNDTINKYLNIQLMKYNLKLKEWDTYSQDVFSQPSKPLELSLIISAKGFLKLGFANSGCDWLDSPMHSKRENKFYRDKSKIGLFRLKVFSGSEENNKIDTFFSHSFKIEK